MVEIKAISYEQARKDFFELEMQKAQRRMKYWETRIDRTRPNNLMDVAHGKAADAGWEYNFYNDALEALENQPKWISVEERLPEPFHSVIVHMPQEKPCPTVHEGYRTNDGHWYSAHFVREFDEVTHWMPLPEAPKER